MSVMPAARLQRDKVLAPDLALRYTGLLGSANQTIHLMTARHTLNDLARVPSREIVLHVDGTLSVSGIRPWRPK